MGNGYMFPVENPWTKAMAGVESAARTLYLGKSTNSQVSDTRSMKSTGSMDTVDKYALGLATAKAVNDSGILGDNLLGDLVGGAVGFISDGLSSLGDLLFG